MTRAALNTAAGLYSCSSCKRSAPVPPTLLLLQNKRAYNNNNVADRVSWNGKKTYWSRPFEPTGLDIFDVCLMSSPGIGSQGRRLRSKVRITVRVTVSVSKDGNAVGLVLGLDSRSLAVRSLVIQTPIKDGTVVKN